MIRSAGVRRRCAQRSRSLARDVELEDELIHSSPESFRSSWLPKELADSISVQPGLENLPAFVAHGTRDTMIPIARAQESRELLIKRGLGLTYREYEMEHGIAPEALRDLVEWMDSKVFRPILIA